MTSEFEVLNPVAQFRSDLGKFLPATRIPSLDGRSIGLYWNYKPGGNWGLERVGEML